jgi:hypothetical protein
MSAKAAPMMPRFNSRVFQELRMSVLNSNHQIDPQDPLYYAPLRLRKADPPGAAPPRRVDHPIRTAFVARPLAPERRPNHDALLEHAVAAALSLPLEPVQIPQVALRKGVSVKLVLGIAGAVAIAAGAAFCVALIPAPRPQPAIAEAVPKKVPEPTRSAAIAMPAAPKIVAAAYEAPAISSAAAEPEPRMQPRQAVKPVTDEAASSTPADTPRQLSADEIAGLLKRGEEFARSGDFPAARLLLQRAAEAHHARAAYLLAATYDPKAIETFGASSVLADADRARAWYQKAQNWGSAEAPDRLEALASAGR